MHICFLPQIEIFSEYVFVLLGRGPKRAELCLAWTAATEWPTISESDGLTYMSHTA